ncbi:Neurogenic locus notch-like protein 1-like [Oopsacas minuta]|uniref:Neurogenic locus notch-like protein 1-like n=1 Tax=Oopsacas minuta TaxID=111878 RepID=A0AAV7K3J2_9METZ|nr:Neurogenic locus notch-like protein 1-like [Oopsacas minuta]
MLILKSVLLFILLFILLLYTTAQETDPSSCDDITPLSEDAVCSEGTDRVCYRARAPQDLEVTISYKNLCDNSLCIVSQLNPVLAMRGDSFSLSFSEEPFFNVPLGLSVYLFPGEQSFITCDQTTNYDQLVTSSSQALNATLSSESLLDGINYLTFTTDITCVYLRMVVNVQTVDCVSPDSPDVDTLCGGIGVCAASTNPFSEEGYSCVCPAGVNFKDNYCGDIDECSSEPCQNGGDCIEGVECGFTCECTSGYTGTLCETEIIDACDSNPCANGSECIPENNEFRCVCPPGITGLICDEKVNNCMHEPCLNGICNNLLDDYSCTCLLGYTGRNCSSLIDYCNHFLCLSGECMNITGSYVCICPPNGREFSTCSCYEGLCNRGECSDDTGYALCSCPNGFSGVTCETDLDLCEIQNTCSEFGTCQETSDGSDTVCICQATHTDVNCSTPIDPCFDITCNSRGSCISMEDSYVCDCIAGYTGNSCEIPDPCSTEPCSNMSTCVNATNTETGDEFQCVCPPGVTGPTCDTLITCDISPCNNGTCITDSNPGLITCICPLGTGGMYCEREVDIVTPLFRGEYSYLGFLTPILGLCSELRIRFRASRPNGIVLFSSLNSTDIGDYILVHMSDGFVSVRFDCGSGEETTLITDQRLDDDIFHILNISIASCRVELSVNTFHSSAVSGPGSSTIINLNTGLYIGGVPESVNLPFGVDRVGLFGCISNLEIGESGIHLNNPIEGRHVENCEDDVCQGINCPNGGRCVHSGTVYSCICPDGSELDTCGLSACLDNPCMHGGECLLQGGQAVCVCQPFFTGPFCEQKASIRTPFFSGNQHSFIKHGLINQELVSISLTVRPNASFISGVIMYTSENMENGLGDYLLLALSGGYPVIQWDLGSGQGLLSSSIQLLVDTWYRIQVTRSGSTTSMSVDGSSIVSANSSGSFQVLNTGSSLYLGGVSFLNFISPLAAALGINGFIGCIEEFQALSIRGDSVLSNEGGSESGSGVSECEEDPCVPNVCQNGGECVSIMGGMSCVCLPGYTGVYCSSLLEAEDCSTQECESDAICIMLSSGPQCLCPLGKTGDRCGQNILISYPSFKKSPFAYLQYSIEDVTDNTDVLLEFYTQSRYGLILFTSQNTKTKAGDFLSLAVFEGRLELRWNLGSGVGLLQWPEALALFQWYRVEVRRTARLSELRVIIPGSQGNVSSIIGNSQGTLTSLNTNGVVYIGGADSYVRAATSSGVASGLNGCIRDLTINNRPYTHTSATKGIDIESCIPHPCISHVCSSGSTCESSGNFNSYSCVCSVPQTGELCDVIATFENASFSGDSYVEYSFISNPVTTEIALRFRTMYSEGLIAWVGIEGGDYLSIGLRGGQVYGYIDLGSGVTSWSFDNIISYSIWHSLTLFHKNNELIVVLDSESLTIRLTGLSMHFNPTGGIWIGGHEDIEMTGFTSGLKGCVSQLSVSGLMIDLDNPSEIISSRNVISCDS